MAQTLESDQTMSAEELQRLVDGETQRCTLTEECHLALLRLPKFLQKLFQAPPKCDEPAVARYEISCDSHGSRQFWVCADHEIEMVRSYPQACFSGEMMTLRRVS